MVNKQQNFELAAAEVENFFKANGKATDDQKLALYAHFKQAKVGDCNTEKPGFMDFKGKAKWEAWNKLKGMSKEDAAAKYVEVAKSFLPADIAKTL